MPTYVYGCDTCDHRFEMFQKFHDAPLRECPECGAPIRKIFQPAAVVFKGSGWYSTDSRAGKGGSSESAPSNGDKDAKESGDGASAAPKSEDGAKAATKSAAPTEKSPAPAGANE